MSETVTFKSEDGSLVVENVYVGAVNDIEKNTKQ